MVNIAIITYSLYGHIDILAKAVQRGIKEAGGSADIYRVNETLPEEALQKLQAPPKAKDIPVVDKDVLKNYDAFLFGIPTRYGNVPAQWASFWDQTGGLWVEGALEGKAAGFFTSTASYGGGQDSTVKNSLDYLSHHGMIIIPLGYKSCFAELSCIDEIHGAGPWGSGTLAGPDGSRSPSDLELRVASIQGRKFFHVVNRLTSTSKLVNDTKRKKVEGNQKSPTQKELLEQSKNEVEAKKKATNPNDCCAVM
ncbi:hypothetical protein MOUN0_I03708 [Monosporozyma unispora]|nr:flavodoxin-like fold protein [Kazachstania unispora]